MIRYSAFMVFFFVFSVIAHAQVDEMEKMRQQEEAFKKKQQQQEAQFKQDEQEALEKLYQEYLEYEKEREELVLKFLGKNIDEDLREKAEQLEKLQPRDVTYLEKNNPNQLVTQLTEAAQLAEDQESSKPDVETPTDKQEEKTEKASEEIEKSRPTDKTRKELRKERRAEKKAEKAAPIKQELADQENEEVEVQEKVEEVEVEKKEVEVAEVIQKEIEANRPVFIPLKQDAYRISSHFNPDRMHPTLKKRRPHKGIDLAAPTGTPIYASADGIVEISQFSKSAGNWILLNHKNGYKTKYFHLNKLAVKAGSEVQRGDLIGYVGSTGYSSGPHLHYEIRKKNVPIDPKHYFLAHL